MSDVPLETCWDFNKLWNNKCYYKAASCWYFYWVFETTLDSFSFVGNLNLWEVWCVLCSMLKCLFSLFSNLTDNKNCLGYEIISFTLARSVQRKHSQPISQSCPPTVWWQWLQWKSKRDSLWHWTTPSASDDTDFRNYQYELYAVLFVMFPNLHHINFLCKTDFQEVINRN
jgi:hypothetical protein